MLNSMIILGEKLRKELIINLGKMNQAFGHLAFDDESTLGRQIHNLQAMSAVTIFFEANTMQQMWAAYSGEPKSSEGDSSMTDFRARLVPTCSLVLSILFCFEANKKAMLKINKKQYQESMGCITLLNVLFAYNAHLTYPPDSEHYLPFLNKSIDWMVIFESSILPELDSGFYTELRTLLCKKLDSAKVKLFVDKEKSSYPYLFPQELSRLIERKNQRATRFGIPCSYTVIHRKNSDMLFQIDLDTFMLLKQEIEAIIKTQAEQPRVFLFYVNQDSGPVELLRVKFNQKTKQLELVNLSAGNSIIQYYFLVALRASLDRAKVSYQIFACQADMLANKKADALHAYCFSGMLACLSVDKLKESKFQAEQPNFYDANERTLSDVQNLPKINWFTVGALGEKALMMAPTHHAIKASIVKRHPTKGQGTTRFNEMMRKYNLTLAPFVGSCHFYDEYVYQRAKENLGVTDAPLFSLAIRERMLNDGFDCEKEGLLEASVIEAFKQLKLSSPLVDKKLTKQEMPTAFVFSPQRYQAMRLDDEKTMRRSSAGFCTFQEFELLLNHSLYRDCRDVFDPKRQYTPLQLALRNQLPRQALLLLESGVELAKKNDKGESAKDTYIALPADSPVKRNTKIMSFFR